MSISYDKHKSQVEAARKANGEFGSYQAGESGATLAAAEAADHGYDREGAKAMVGSEGRYPVEPTTDELDSSIDQAMEAKDWQAVDVGEVGGVETLGLADGQGNKLVEIRNDKDRGFHEVWDHSAEEPRMVSSTTAGYATAEDIASRAADHFDSLTSGRDPLKEAQWRDLQGPRDGLPESHGFDFTETHPQTQELAFNINDSFGAYHEVLGYDSGGGNEILSVAGGEPGQRYEAKISSLEGGDLDNEGWAVTAAYQDSDGEWIEDEDELTFNPVEIEDTDDYSAVEGAVKAKLSRARATRDDSF